MTDDKKKIDAWLQIKNNELRRWKNALEKATGEVVNEKFKGRVFKGEDLNEITKFTFLVRQTNTALLFNAEHIMRNVPNPTSKAKCGTEWEAYLSGLRVLLGKFGKSYLVKAIAPVFKAQELADLIISLSREGLRLMPFFYNFSKKSREYVAARESALRIWGKYSDKEPDMRLISAYASWKTWERNEDHDVFFNALHCNVAKGIEIYIEGPIQLYLIIVDRYFTLIYKIFSIEKLNELTETKDSDLQSVSALNDFLRRIANNSEVRPIVLALIKQASKIYLNALHAEEKENRRFVTQAKSLKFIKDFESGRLIDGR